MPSDENEGNSTDLAKNYYETARTMFIQEHERWKTWGFLFLGAIGVPYASREVFGQWVPLWFMFGLSSATSLLAVFVMTSIRRSTDSWMRVLESLEAGGKTPPFTLYQRNYRDWSPRKDLCSHFGGEPNGRRTGGLPSCESQAEHASPSWFWHSVTRTLVVMSLGLALLFGVLAVQVYFTSVVTDHLDRLGRAMVQYRVKELVPGGRLIRVYPLESKADDRFESYVQLPSGDFVLIPWTVSDAGAVVAGQPAEVGQQKYQERVRKGD